MPPIDSYILLGNWGVTRPRDTYPKAHAAAQRALQIDPGLAEAHTSLAVIHERYDTDSRAAESEYQRAIELKPAYSTARHRYGVFLAAMGRFGEALDQIKQAQTLDPLSLIISADIGWIYYLARRYDEAIAESRATLDMDARFAPAQLHLGMACVQTRLFDEAAQWLRSAADLAPGLAPYTMALGYAFGAAGRADEARAILDALETEALNRYTPPLVFALIHAGLGELDAAFSRLDQAVDDRSFWNMFLEVEPMCDQLRSDPRFDRILNRIRGTIA